MVPPWRWSTVCGAAGAHVVSKGVVCWNTYIAACVPVSRAIALSCQRPQSQWHGSELDLFFFSCYSAEQLFSHLCSASVNIKVCCFIFPSQVLWVLLLKEFSHTVGAFPITLKLGKLNCETEKTPNRNNFFFKKHIRSFYGHMRWYFW